MSFKYSYCLGVTPFEVKYLPSGEAVFAMGNTDWKAVSEKPGTVTITCNDTGPHEETWTYRWKGEDLEFYDKAQPGCGEFIMYWAKQP